MKASFARLPAKEGWFASRCGPPTGAFLSLPGKAAAVIAAAGALAACAVIAPVPERPARPFELIGRVAVSYDGRAFMSAVRWRHTRERDEFWLLSPAGQTLAYIVDDADGATFTGPDRKVHRASNVENLTRRALGWELPLAHLAWWVKGDPAPGSAARGN